MSAWGSDSLPSLGTLPFEGEGTVMTSLGCQAALVHLAKASRTGRR